MRGLCLFIAPPTCVSHAFVFLYRVLCQRIALHDAERDLHAIWQPDDVWSQFIQQQLKTHEPSP